MSTIIKMFMDDDGNEVPEEQATRLNIAEYDDDGNRIQELYMVREDETEKKIDERWDDIEIDPNNEWLKNAVYFNKRDPIQEYIDEMKAQEKKTR